MHGGDQCCSSGGVGAMMYLSTIRKYYGVYRTSHVVKKERWMEVETGAWFGLVPLRFRVGTAQIIQSINTIQS